MAGKGKHIGAYLQDDLLIDKWEAIPKGERGEVLRDALEQYFQMPPSKRRNPLSRIADDLAKAVKMIEEVQTAVKALAARPVNYSNGPLPTVDSETQRLAAERTENMKKNAW
jgi:aminoglycoside phosphotransferase (APT) family kinase protein